MICDDYVIRLMLLKDLRKRITIVDLPNFHQSFHVIFMLNCFVTMLWYSDVIGSLHFTPAYHVFICF